MSAGRHGMGARGRGRRVARWFLLGVVTGAVVAPLLATWAAPGGAEAVDLAVNLANRRLPPGTGHWFGTDDLGRDVLVRVLVGARVSLAIGLLSAVCSAALGVVVGSVAALGRRWMDDLLMRATDAMLAIPRLPLLMLAAAVLRPGVPLLVVLVAATGWMEAARVSRAAVATLAAQEYVAAARAAGSAPWRVWWRHLLPGVLPVATVATTLSVGRGILLESTLSFFGVGVQPPAASWGNMLYQAQATMASAPWLALVPGACIFVTVLACTVAADGAGEGRPPLP